MLYTMLYTMDNGQLSLSHAPARAWGMGPQEDQLRTGTARNGILIESRRTRTIHAQYRLFAPARVQQHLCPAPPAPSFNQCSVYWTYSRPPGPGTSLRHRSSPSSLRYQTRFRVHHLRPAAPPPAAFGARAASRAVGLSCLTLIIVRFSRDYRELRFKNTIIPLPY